MRIRLRALTVGFLVLVVLGALTACSSGRPTEVAPVSVTSPTTAGAARFPQSAQYIADVQADGKTVVIGISLDGNQVTAYARNDIGDEAWFFGIQTDGTTHITSNVHDTLSASFIGDTVSGGLTMNGTTYTFTAATASTPAGIDTAGVAGVRGSGEV
jgi:hypothetical protein